MQSRKLQLVLASTSSVILMLVVMAGSLSAAARIAEKNGAYPWRQEDFLRYMLPNLHADLGARRILLLGPSEAREDLIYQRFEEAFPGMEAYQGGQSLGTFNDTLLALDYMARVYGSGSMPNTLVLGITPRFVSNIPRDVSPMVISIDRYSPYLRVEKGHESETLVAKSFLEGLNGRLNFFSKQKARYWAAIASAVNRVIDDPLPYVKYEDKVFPLTRDALAKSGVRMVATLAEGAWGMGLKTFLARMTKLYISPYKYHHRPPMASDIIDGWIHDPESFWSKVREWNPGEDSILIERQFEQLLALAERGGIRLYVVNLPENPRVSASYRPGYYQRYIEAIRAALKDTPFLDLREMLPEEAFYDAGHLNLPSALKTTERIINFLEQQDG
jgi:hypothetical protein